MTSNKSVVCDEIMEVELHHGDKVETGERIWIVKNLSKQSISEFDSLFKKIEKEQNQVPEYVQTIGPVEIQCLPVKAMKRVQTEEEKRQKKREYSRKRNRDPKVIQKRKERAEDPVRKAARELLNKDPKVKKYKGYSGQKRRRTLKFIQQNNIELYEQAKAWAIEKLKQEEEERLQEEEARKARIETLEKELNMQVE